MKQLSLVTLLVLFSAPAMAYVGPGLGMGVIGTIFGVLAAIVLALFGLFWYPLKRAFSKRKSTIDSSQTTPDVIQNEQADHLDTTLARLEIPTETPLNNQASNHSSALNGKTDTSTAKRTDSQIQ